MDKRAVLDRLTRDEDERITLGRVWDLAEKCESRDIPGHTGFLTPQEQLLCQNLLQTLGLGERAAFWGGYGGAQRCQLHLLPSWAEGPEEDAIAALRVRWYTGEHPTHRDLLGSLMGLGITRQTIGDILVDGSGDAADILTVPTTAEYLLQQWDRAGRTPFSVRRWDYTISTCPGRNTRRFVTRCPPCGWTVWWPPPSLWPGARLPTLSPPGGYRSTGRTP